MGIGTAGRSTSASRCCGSPPGAAGRSGIDDNLLLPLDWRPAPAGVVVDALIDHVAPALTDAGDPWPSSELWQDLRSRRPGAHHQRLAYRDGGLRGVVHDAITAAEDLVDDAATGTVS